MGNMPEGLTEQERVDLEGWEAAYAVGAATDAPPKSLYATIAALRAELAERDKEAERLKRLVSEAFEVLEPFEWIDLDMPGVSGGYAVTGLVKRLREALKPAESGKENPCEDS